MTVPLDVFKARWLAAPMPIPFVEVVNTPVTVDQLPDQWGTAFEDSTARDDVTMGSNPWVVEEGNLVCALFCRSGTGRNILDAATDALRSIFHGYQTDDHLLHFVGVIGPSGDDPEAVGEWYRLTFLIVFRRSSRRVEPPVPATSLLAT